jgi:phospholipid/cholesterol/gamma-HCH transport system ATP-binding protein
MIKIENITKIFDGNKVINDLSLTVEEGEKVAIIGPSGCGKSTLLRLIMGLHSVNSGEIFLHNKDVTKMNKDQIKRARLKCGMLFQSSALFDSFNVEENIAFPLVENFAWPEWKVEERVREVLELVEMSGAEKKAPSDLSGGQKKRIGLARAIAANPDVMLYDEPTTGLDPILSTNIEDLMVKLNDQLKVTSVIVTHQISTILRTADKIYLLHNGKLLPPETPDTIYNSDNDYIRKFIRGGISDK